MPPVHPRRLTSRRLRWLGSLLIAAGLLVALLAVLNPQVIPIPAVTPRQVDRPTPSPAYLGTPLDPPPLAANPADAPALVLPQMPLAVESPAASTLAPAQSPPATPSPRAPETVQIPAIGLNAPVQPVGWEPVEIGGETFGRWTVPDAFTVGWHVTSAPPGAGGNTVLNGHHNAHGQVFGRLVDLVPGDAVIVKGGGRTFRYTVSQVMVLAEEGAAPADRLANARWIQPTPDERLTLVTCWPPEGNSHRLIVVALPDATTF